MIKNLLQNKGIGFYVALVAAVVALVAALIYMGGYSASPLMSWRVFVLPLIAFVLMAAAVALCFVKCDKIWHGIALRILPVAAAVLCFLGLLYFGYSVYNYVSEVLYGIDRHYFDPEFLGSAIFLVLSVVLCNACVYLRPLKKQD